MTSPPPTPSRTYFARSPSRPTTSRDRSRERERERDPIREAENDGLLPPTHRPLSPDAAGPSRGRAVSLTASIASVAGSIASFATAQSRPHSRNASYSKGKRRESDASLREFSDEDYDLDLPRSPSTPTSSRGSVAFSDASAEVDELEFDYDEEAEADEPLVRRRRKKLDEPGDRSLWELIAPLVLAHPLALFPALASVPHDFLPAGVALFVPLFVLIAVLSACAHIVIVYLAWYLKVRAFEDVFAACVGERFGRYGLGVGRAFVLGSTMGTAVGWIGSLYPLLQPLADTYFPDNFLRARITWILVASLTLVPALVPSRTFRGLRYAPTVLALLLPVVAFIAIGRTVEIRKLADEGAAAAAAVPIPEAATQAARVVKRGLTFRGISAGNFGSGLTTVTMFFTPHLQTLPIHSTLQRNQRQSFPLPCLATSVLIILLSLPTALVPYYLLEPAPTVFAQLPAADKWTNAARVLMAAVVLGSTTLWLLRGRDCVLAALDVDRGERYKAGRWVGIGMWVVVAGLACLGGIVADKVEMMGVMATIAVGWLMPSLFFIVTFHVRSPLAIIFPSHAPPPPMPDEEPSTSNGNGHIRTASLDDPAADVLLARKERQLQKRRLGRRLWQDMVVYLGILPVGCVTLVWCVGSFIGLW